MRNRKIFIIKAVSSLPLVILMFFVISNPGTIVYKSSIINLTAFILYNLLADDIRKGAIKYINVIWLILTNTLLIFAFLVESGRI